MESDGDGGSNDGWSEDVGDVDLCDVIKVEAVEIRSGWFGIEGTQEIFHSDSKSFRQGLETRFDYFNISSAVAFYINIVSRVISFHGEWRKIGIIDDLVKLLLRVHRAVKLSPCLIV